MTPAINHKRLDEVGQAMIEDLLQKRLRLAIKYTLVQALEEEVEAFVNASPYQRTFERRDYRNGRYERGTHEELLAHGGLYKEIHDLQLVDHAKFAEEMGGEDVERSELKIEALEEEEVE